MLWHPAKPDNDAALPRSVKASVDTPQDMIDQNVKIDYGKLRHLVVLDRRLNGNFSRLEEIIETGGIRTNIVESFPVEDLTRPDLIRGMAYDGEWQPVFRFLADEVEKQTSIRDYLTGEKVIQTFLLAYLNVTDYYMTRTEEEMGMGFIDLYLEPFVSKYPDVKYGYLIELKYVARTGWSEEVQQELLAEAREQLRQYAADERVLKRSQGITLKCLTLVFCGWELKAAEECYMNGM